MGSNFPGFLSRCQEKCSILFLEQFSGEKKLLRNKPQHFFR